MRSAVVRACRDARCVSLLASGWHHAVTLSAVSIQYCKRIHDTAPYSYPRSSYGTVAKGGAHRAVLVLSRPTYRVPPDMARHWGVDLPYNCYIR